MSGILRKLNSVRAFEAAGRHESLTAAAEELNVSHPSISRHVKELETLLGVALFKRSYQGVKLTLAGRELLQAVSPALNAIADAVETIGSTRYSRIVVNCEPAFGLKWLVPNIHKFEVQHKDIDVTIVSSRELTDLNKFEADLAVRHCMIPPEDPGASMFSDSRMYPYAAPGTVGPRSPAEIAKLPLIFERRTRFWTDWFEYARVPGFKIPERLKKLPIEMAIEAACSGSGIVLSSSELVHEDVERGRLERVCDVGKLNGKYYIMQRQDTLKRRAVNRFKQWLLEETKRFREKSSG